MTTRFATILLKTAGIIFAVDLLYLFTGGIYFRRMIEQIQGQPFSPRYLAGIPVYLALAYLLLQTKSYTEAALYGAAVYAVYDMTNYTLFRDYDLTLAIVDTIWGGILFMVSRYIIQKV